MEGVVVCGIAAVGRVEVQGEMGMHVREVVAASKVKTVDQWSSRPKRTMLWAALGMRMLEFVGRSSQIVSVEVAADLSLPAVDVGEILSVILPVHQPLATWYKHRKIYVFSYSPCIRKEVHIVGRGSCQSPVVHAPRRPQPCRRYRLRYVS